MPTVSAAAFNTIRIRAPFVYLNVRERSCTERLILSIAGQREEEL
jgi:hypothetical protein